MHRWIVRVHYANIRVLLLFLLGSFSSVYGGFSAAASYVWCDRHSIRISTVY